MKKIFYLSILVLIIIFMHTIVLADSVIPLLEPYNATVSNENGAEYFSYTFNGTNGDSIDSKGFLDYGTQINVQSEEYLLGKYYCRFKIVDNPSSMLYYIALENITINEDSIVTDITPNYSDPHTFTVIAEDGVSIHKGPAQIYDVIGKTIPYNTVITAYGVSSTTDNPWYYITYLGVSGFITEQYGALGHSSSKIISIKAPVDLKVYEKVTSNTLAGTITANKEIKKFMELDKWSNMFYIDEGTKGYVHIDQTAVIRHQIYDRYIKVPQSGLVLYKNADAESDILVDHIPEDTILIGEYEQYEMTDSGWVNVTYENNSGWIFLDSELLEESNQLTNEQYGEYANTTSDTENILSEENVIEENIVEENTLPVETEKKSTNIKIPTITIVCFVTGVFFIIGSIVLVKISSPKKNK